MEKLKHLENEIKEIACNYFDWCYDWDCFYVSDRCISINFKCNGQDFEDILVNITIENNKIIEANIKGWVFEIENVLEENLFAEFQRDIERRL